MIRPTPVLLLAVLALGACRAPAHPVAARPSASLSPSPSISVLPPTTAPVKPVISKAGLAYFNTVALGVATGDKYSVVTKWTLPVVTVRVQGGDARARTCVNTVIADFNALTATSDLRLSANPADIEVHLAPVSKFKSLLPQYESGNDGWVNVQWSRLHYITGATVLVRSTGNNATDRCHLLREQLTEGMGLLGATKKYRSSIFYGEYYPTVTKYSAIDKEVIRLLYSEAVQPGDDKARVRASVTVK
ncbi:DUF2927 domain-containing protein [Actinoplanes sp. L3-i22]|uniref:DUF2927 domain-containing protein n=1 Tax=Actinoplanes sp. L3-i22 TaxID=2836373 RepID=UPI001C77AFEA|nr:DUF2927 domain-containing protein [Actinoplanes sp. L3-i22]BCY11348.1 hypothetical protein L3i22_064360 [Actinoplanes sp. L3-i22]